MLTPSLNQPQLLEHVRRFLYDQFHPDAEVCGMDTPLDSCPAVPNNLRIKVYHSATLTYHAPSDLSGIGGMHHEIIRATPSWKKGPVADDFGYVCLDKGKRESVNVVDTSKHNAETSHAQRLRQ